MSCISKLMAKMVILFFLFAFLFSACTDNAGEYILDKKCNTKPDLKIIKIIVTENETIIKFNYRNTSRNTFYIKVYPPGHQEAFYIIKSDKSKKFHLLDIKGIPIAPMAAKIKKGEILEFTLTFERIENSMKRFHVIEGEIEGAGRNWHFLNVNIDKVKKIP